MIANIATLDRDSVVHRIAELEHELFASGAWSEQAVRQELDAPARTYLVDIDDADQTTIRGYAGFWYDSEDAELMTIAVDPAYQRQGIAAGLLNALIEQARLQGAGRMLLEVRVDNDPALNLYQRFGFIRMGIRRRYYQPEGIDAYTMALELKKRVVGFQPSTNDAPHDHTKEQA